MTIIQMHHQTLHGQRGTSVQVLPRTSVHLRFRQVDKKPHTKKKKEKTNPKTRKSSHSHRRKHGPNLPNRFFSVTRWRLNLSSGEKRAGWADDVGKPLASTFFRV